MQIKPEQLEGQLAQELQRVYLISGDEPLRMEELREHILDAAAKAGFVERVRLEVQRGFDWGELSAAAQTQSLFGDRRLIELRVGSGKIGDKGSKALLEFAAQGADVVLLVTGGRFEKSVLNTAWYKALARTGTAIQVWPLKRAELERWIQQACERRGLVLERPAAQLLAGLCEGNSLAAAQEVTKLALLHESGERIGAAAVTQAVASSSRYSAFDLVDALADRQSARWSVILESLRQCGSDPLQLLGALLWQLRRQDGGVGQRSGLRLLLDAAHEVEAGTKGLIKVSPWNALFDFCMLWRGSRLPEAAV